MILAGVYKDLLYRAEKPHPFYVILTSDFTIT